MDGLEIFFDIFFGGRRIINAGLGKTSPTQHQDRRDKQE
jgi:hypothetical protein